MLSRTPRPRPYPCIAALLTLLASTLPACQKVVDFDRTQIVEDAGAGDAGSSSDGGVSDQGVDQDAGPGVDAGADAGPDVDGGQADGGATDAGAELDAGPDAA